MECGLPGYAPGIASGIRCIESLLGNPEEERKGKNKSQNISIYHTSATLYIAPDKVLCFHPQPFAKDRHLCFVSHLDEFNFKRLEAGTVLGKISDSKQLRLVDKNGLNIFDQFFSIVENDLTVKSPFNPLYADKKYSDRQI